jgi:hypothetical protein
MQELNHALMAAIKAKDVKRVIELLNEGASPNFKEEVCPSYVMSHICPVCH